MFGFTLGIIAGSYLGYKFGAQVVAKATVVIADFKAWRVARKVAKDAKS